MAEISVIIPTFNRAHFLGETLDSIIAQSFENWECLVIDDGSKDYTEELMQFYKEKDARISYHKRPESRSKGANACRNYGFEISKGDYINFFDDDDLMQTHKLELQIKALKQTGENFSVCQAEVKDKPEITVYSKLKTKDPFYDYLRMNIHWLTQPPLWKRKFLVDNYLSFDEELGAAQEWEFHCRVLNIERKYHIIEENLVTLRKHEGSISYGSNIEFREYNYFLARYKIYSNPKLNLREKDYRYLEKYLLNKFKGMIVEHNKFKIKAYKKFVLNSTSMSFNSKINAIAAIISFTVFGRGNFFLKKIRYL